MQVPPDLLTNGRPLAMTGGATAGLPLAMREAIETAVEGVVGPLREELARATERAERAERQVAVLRAKLIASRLAGEKARADNAAGAHQFDAIGKIQRARCNRPAEYSPMLCPATSAA